MTSESQSVRFPYWRFAFSTIWLVGLTTVGLVLTGFWHAGSFDHLELLELEHVDHWQVYEPEDYGCSIEFPGFTYDVQLNPQSAEFPEQYATRSVRPFESFGIAAQKHHGHGQWDKAQVAQTLKIAFRHFEQKYTGLKMQSEESMIFDDFPALQRSYTMPKYGHVVGRVVLLGDRSFLMIVAGKNISATDPRVQRFLESLTIIDMKLLTSAREFSRRVNPRPEPKRELLPEPRVFVLMPKLELLPAPRLAVSTAPTREQLPAPRVARAADSPHELLPEPRLAFDPTPKREQLPAPRVVRKPSAKSGTKPKAKS